MHGKPYERLEPQQIALNALASDPVCIMVCEIRAAATLSAAGSLALVGGCRGGVTLAGGVSERMINFFKTDKAVARFTKRGPRTAYMQRIPIRVMHNPNAPLIGAAALLRDGES